MSVRNGPGEGTWSVFAETVARERDDLLVEVTKLREQVRLAAIAIKDRDALERKNYELLELLDDIQRLAKNHGYWLEGIIGTACYFKLTSITGEKEG